MIHRACFATTLIAGLLLWMTNPAAAQSELALTVTNELDSGPGSYRQAIADASASGGSDIITFTDVFDITLGSDVDLTGFAAVTLEGNGSTIRGANNHQILDATAPVTIRT